MPYLILQRLVLMPNHDGSYYVRPNDFLLGGAANTYALENWSNNIDMLRLMNGSPPTFKVLSVRMIDEDDPIWRRILRLYVDGIITLYGTL